MNLHEVSPDGRFGFRADGAMNWDIRTGGGWT